MSSLANIVPLISAIGVWVIGQVLNWSLPFIICTSFLTPVVLLAIYTLYRRKELRTPTSKNL